MSIGIASYGTHGIQRDVLLAKVDQAMYQAKLDGRNCVRIADASLPAAWSSTLAASIGREQKEQEGSSLDPVQALQGLVTLIQACDPTTSAYSSYVIRLAEYIS